METCLVLSPVLVRRQCVVRMALVSCDRSVLKPRPKPDLTALRELSSEMCLTFHLKKSFIILGQIIFLTTLISA